MSIKRTYLRYECADAFALACNSSSSTSVTPNLVSFLGSTFSSPALFAAGSQCVAFDLNRGQTSSACLKLGHREQSNIGTGHALNSSIVTCIDTAEDNQDVVKVASGWADGAVRIFDVDRSDLDSRDSKNLGTVNSLLPGGIGLDEFADREPLVLNGHSGPVQCLSFDRVRYKCGRVASGGADGAVIIWDIVAEAGLFRLLGHRGAVSHLSFIAPSNYHASANGGGEERTILQGDPMPNALGSTYDGLVSTSLDGLVKIWDLDAQCCTQTLTGHGSEVWSADSALVDSVGGMDGGRPVPRWRLITGASDGRLKVWALYHPRKKKWSSEVIADEQPSGSPETDDKVEPSMSGQDVSTCAIYIGSIARQTNERPSFIKFHPNGKMVGILSHGSRNVEVYGVRSVEESKKRMARRMRRRREKASLAAKKGVEKQNRRGILDDDDDDDDRIGIQNDQLSGAATSTDGDGLSPEVIKASDELEFLGVVRASHKVKGFAFSPSVDRKKGCLCRVVLVMSTNAIEIHSVKRFSKDGEPSTNHLSTLDMYGHPTGIRSISLSSDEVMACTISKGALKLWNVANRSCIRSILLSSRETTDGKAKSVYGLCCDFLRGNSLVVMGTREGRLQLIDVAAGGVLFEEANAHDGAIWSLDIRPDGEALVTGSADHQVKFWEFERDGNSGRTCFVHTRTMKMNDDVVAVRYSHSLDPSKRLVAVSTLDCTVKVFFDDSLKFFLSLYGHKLPALAVDCSDDDVLLASAGADKTIKIWGLDFGDTHRTLHGHSDSITDLRFVRKTHNFFTCSKDKTVRYWDGDRFEQILLLCGHFAEVNTIALSRTGGFLLTGGMDRQVRVWERTKDIVFIEEEKERELEKLFDEVDGGNGDKYPRTGAGIEDDQEQDDEDNQRNQPQSEAAVKRSVMSVAAGDRIVEAIELADQEMKDIAAFRNSNRGNNEQRRPSPMLLGLDPAQYILWVIRSVKSSELEQSLLILPMNHMERLSYYLLVLLRKGMGVELCSRVAVFLVQIHQNQIISNHSMGAPLHELRRLIKLRIGENRDMIGLNLAGMRAVAKMANERRNAFVMVEPSDIWAGLGLESDVAAALERKCKRQKRSFY